MQIYFVFDVVYTLYLTYDMVCVYYFVSITRCTHCQCIALCVLCGRGEPILKLNAGLSLAACDESRCA